VYAQFIFFSAVVSLSNLDWISDRYL